MSFRTNHNPDQQPRPEAGFTLVEVLTYGAGLIVILAGIVTFLFYLYDWYRSATIPIRADQAGVSLMQKVMKDVRNANSVNDSSSIFNSNAGKISVTSTVNSISTTTIYLIETGALKRIVNGGATTTLSTSDVYVSAFNVKKLTTSYSTVVRIEIDVDYHLRAGTTTNIYNGLSILRQSYQ